MSTRGRAIASVSHGGPARGGRRAAVAAPGAAWQIGTMKIEAAIGWMLALAQILTPDLRAPTPTDRRPPWTLPPADYGGAKPLHPEAWYTFEDYPDAAVRRGEQGYVVVRYTITAGGRVGACAVARSSGSPRLDAVLCPLLQRRARFSPARDEHCTPRATTGTSAMQFWLPDG